MANQFVSRQRSISTRMRLPNATQGNDDRLGQSFYLHGEEIFPLWSAFRFIKNSSLQEIIPMKLLQNLVPIWVKNVADSKLHSPGLHRLERCARSMIIVIGQLHILRQGACQLPIAAVESEEEPAFQVLAICR